MTPPKPALPEPFAHICVLPTKDAGPTKFFTAPSDSRGFPVYTRAAIAEYERLSGITPAQGKGEQG